MAGWLKNDPKMREVRYVASSGREYRLTVVQAIDLTGEGVPETLTERPDESYSFGGKDFRSLDECFREFGCILVDFAATEDETN